MMPANDFSLFYKSTLPTDQSWQPSWDLYISAFNSSDRVKAAFDLASAEQKHWLIFPEYGYSADEHPSNGTVFALPETEESAYILAYASAIGNNLSGKSLCVDITGFMRPQLMFLVAYLKHLGIPRFDAIYSEPGQYRDKEKTKFSDGPVKEVRPVNAFEGSASGTTTNDVLVIGVGYDHELIKHVADHKDYATIVPLFGFPSLRPDMYQESVLRASKAGDLIFNRNWEQEFHFALANDPFAVATALQEIVAIQRARNPITNLYLSPLATKPQALGFAIYYLLENHLQPSTILFPFSSRYARETSAGLSRVWRYTVELQ